MSLREALGEVLSPRLQGRLLELPRIREVWDRALPERLAGRLHPEALERGILTIRASDQRAAREAGRSRKALREGLRRALHLPSANLRLRIRNPAPAASPARGRRS